MRRTNFGLLCGLMVSGTLGSSGATAAITYIGNGTMPDFPQVWDPNQKNKAICTAAAFADVMWYWDQNGYSGLVPHKDNTKPNDTWTADGQALVYNAATYIYGRDPGTDAVSKNAAGSVLAAFVKYIRAQGKYADPKNNPNGLAVDFYQTSNATYEKYVTAIKAGGVELSGMNWKDNKGGTIASHAMVSAGLDSTDNELIVTHGWDTHPANMPPYAPPPYAAGVTPYINQYPMTVNASGRAQIENPGDGTVELFGGAKYGAASSMSMSEFYDIHPVAKARVNMKAKPGAGFDYTYQSDVSNDTFEPIYQYIQETETPIDAVSVPAGWTAVPWDYTQTPDVTEIPFQSAQPPYENDTVEAPEPGTLSGILYYTTSNPINPGTDLDGFSFDTSTAYSGMAEDSMSIVSNGVSSFIDSTSTGLTSEAIFPDLTVVPEPACLFLIGVPMLLRRRRRG